MSTQSQQSEIIIKVFIDNKPYEIDCDTGIQDVAWLALSACYLYGQETYPITTYLPIMAKNKQGQILHPKLVILQNRQLIGDEINIKVKRKFGTIGSELSPEEEDWYDNAFGQGRFMQTVSAYLKPVNEIKRDNRFKLEYDFEMEDKENGDRVGKDMAFATKLLVRSTLALDDMVASYSICFIDNNLCVQ